MKPQKKEINTTEQVGSLKRATDCKGHRPHDFVLVLSPYIRVQNGVPFLNAKQIQAYYDSEQRKINDQRIEDTFQKTLGIKVREPWGGYEVFRYYVCAVCFKKKNCIALTIKK